MKRKIKIKSKKSNYSVNFINISKSHFDKTLLPNDVILADRKVVKAHELEKMIKKNKIIQIVASEKNKDFSELGKIIKQLLEINTKRNSRLIVVGGGITQDIGSFISSILFRGIKWIYYPTSFLGQCDSCIGGKTSINFLNNKNQLGNFNPPSQIYIDPNFLLTLSKKDIYSGVGEMSHYFYIKGGNNYKLFLNKYEECLKLNIKSCSELSFKSLMIKKEFVEKDEFDNNYRLLLNYGHTFGHAIEAITNYRIPHGIAVAHGIDIANFISYKRKYITKNEFFNMRIALKNIYKYYPLPKIDILKYIEILKKDKKNINSNIRCVLTKGIGKVFIHEIVINRVFKNTLNLYFTNDNNFPE
jgi:3-dehydroquinate synthase